MNPTRIAYEGLDMNDLLSTLPLFATDDELAIAIVGKKRASEWKRGALIVLDARGFPKFDALHGGRPGD